MNDEPKQEVFRESPQDFHSGSSSDQYTFKPAADGPSQVLVLHIDCKDVDFKRLN